MKSWSERWCRLVFKNKKLSPFLHFTTPSLHDFPRAPHALSPMSPFAQTSFVSYSASRPINAKSALLWITTHVTRVNMITFAVLVVFCFAYIIQVNSTASKGYQIRDLQNTIHELTVANQQSELEIHEAQSLNNIQHAVKMIGMVPADQAVYVDVRGGSVAFAK